MMLWTIFNDFIISSLSNFFIFSYSKRIWWSSMVQNPHKFHQNTMKRKFNIIFQRLTHSKEKSIKIKQNHIKTKKRKKQCKCSFYCLFFRFLQSIMSGSSFLLDTRIIIGCIPLHIGYICSLLVFNVASLIYYAKMIRLILIISHPIVIIISAFSQ